MKNISLKISLLGNVLMVLCVLFLLNKHVYQFGIKRFVVEMQMTKKEKELAVLAVRNKFDNNVAYKQLIEQRKQYLMKTADVVMLGDSITGSGRPWHELLGGIRVANHAIGADTVYGFLQRVDEIVALKPEICFIMGGVNSVTQLPVESIYEDYVKLIVQLRNNGIVPIIQSTIYTSSEGHPYRNREIRKLNKLLKKYALDNGIDFIDLNHYFCKDGTLMDKYSVDGIHLSFNAYYVWAEALQPYLKKYNIEY
ncbi:MAG: hypothetical protein KAJ18_01095 [Candidatus Omnitrophica bacterium]|nr:hypothetical protein [Candidatus Omnitrophota bacterium]